MVPSKADPCTASERKATTSETSRQAHPLHRRTCDRTGDHAPGRSVSALWPTKPRGGGLDTNSAARHGASRLGAQQAVRVLVGGDADGDHLAEHLAPRLPRERFGLLRSSLYLRPNQPP